MNAPTSSDPKYTYIEKTVTRKGKTYKQWFKVKVGQAPAAKKAAAVLMSHAESVKPVAGPPKSGGSGGPAERLVKAEKAIAKAGVEPTRGDVIMKTKVGGQLGSNEGGMYVGSDGVKRYVKHYKDPTQAASEKLAASIYKDLGHQPPHLELFTHAGKKSIASEIIEGQKLDEALGSAAHGKEIAQRFMKGFAADVLTANWDAAGLTKDNAILSKQGYVHRIDMGGSLLKRASGANKPEHLLNDIKEWEGLFDPKVNKSYAEVAKLAGVKKAEDLGDQLHQDLGKILKLQKKYGGWGGYIAKNAPELASANPEAFKKTVDMLTARTKLLQERIDKIPPGDPGVGFKYVQKEVLKKGKTHKQWFKVKDKEAEANEKASKLKKVAPPVKLTKEQKINTIFDITEKLKAENPKGPEDKSVWQVAKAPATQLPEHKFVQLSNESTAAYQKLPHEQKSALLAYTGSSYRVMRAIQAGDMSQLANMSKSDLDGWKEKVRHLEEGQKALAIDNPTKNGVLHRGFNVSQDVLHAMLTGDTITHDGYSTNSTSYSRLTSEGFMTKQHEPHDDPGGMKYPVMIVYTKVKSGTNLMHQANGSSHEQEIALGKGNFRILEKRFVQAAGQYADAKTYHEFVVEEID